MVPVATGNCASPWTRGLGWGGLAGGDLCAQHPAELVHLGLELCPLGDPHAEDCAELHARTSPRLRIVGEDLRPAGDLVRAEGRHVDEREEGIGLAALHDREAVTRREDGDHLEARVGWKQHLAEAERWGRGVDEDGRELAACDTANECDLMFDELSEIE